jgi:hypothetical protein
MKVHVFPANGPLLRNERDVVDLIGEVFSESPDWVALPTSRLPEDFFRLRTRLAGEMIQKFVNYGLWLAIVGDLSQQVAASEALADFVRESNRGGQVWFVQDLDELQRKLGTAYRPS